MKKQIKSNNIIEIRQELFLDNPKKYLEKLCCFLGINAPADYLEDCSRIIYKFPHKSRNDLIWISELIEIVKNKIHEFDFLPGHSYENWL